MQQNTDRDALGGDRRPAARQAATFHAGARGPPAPAAAPAAEATPAEEAAPAEETAAEATPAEAAQEAAPEAAPAAEAAPVTVVSHDIFFEPKEITIPANTDVTFSLPNEGVTLHNFAIDALGVDVDIAPGETQEVVINAPAGTYEIYCNVPGHKAAGMVATLTVEEGAVPAAEEAAPAAEEATSAEAATAEAPAEEATPAAAAEAAAEPEAAAPAAAAGPVEVVSHDIFFEPNSPTSPSSVSVSKPASFAVGTSASAGARCAFMSASTFTLPAATCGRMIA